MTKHFLKTLAALLVIAGGVMVVVDAFGTATANQYLFNLLYLVLILPASVCLWFKVDGRFEGITD